eukprot:TRINITY_DN57394_c0_g1_i1.p1 TRINITY_DN57394_c0_g1~~TRINITY_DN57394_c0_g1_i1.p1  ORF type:complete len:530 (+),score=246.93 TRINITY_DN57394_c0_g1_i1:53-1591(+)
MDWNLICLVAIVLLVVRFQEAARRYARRIWMLRSIRAPRGHWFLGNLPQLRGETHKAIVRFCETVGEWRAFKLWVGPWMAVLVLCEPEMVKEVLVTQRDNFDISERLELKQMTGLSLLTVQGAEWKPMRKTLNPAFHFAKLVSFIRPFNDFTAILLRDCGKWAEEHRLLTVQEMFSRLTLDVIGVAAFATKFNAQQEVDNDFVSRLSAAIGAGGVSPVIARLRAMLLPHWYVFKQLREWRQELNDMTLKILDERLEAQKRLEDAEDDEAFYDSDGKDAGERPPQDLIGLLLECRDDAGRPLSKQTILDNLITFLLAGHETTSTLMSWVLYLLSQHEHIEEKLVDEIRRVVPPNAPPTYDDIKKLTYLEQVLKETLRVYAPVPLLARMTTRDVRLKSFPDIVIPKSTPVLIPPYVMHMNKKEWKDPDVVRPERFSKEESAGRHRFAFLPFSGGQRDCIGKNFAMYEAKVVLCQLLRDFRFTMADDKPVKSQVSVVNRPEGGLRMHVHRRRRKE